MTENENDDIEIVLEPLEGEKQDQIVVEHAEDDHKPQKNNVLSAEDGIDELRAKLEQERTARAEAERRAREASEAAIRAQAEVNANNLHIVNNTIDNIKRDNETLKANYADALATGDYNQAAEIQQALNTNIITLKTLENGKRAAEEKAKEPPPRPAYVDPVDNLISQVEPQSPKSAQWLRANKRFLGNEKTLRKMFNAHTEAIDDGIIPDSEQYFEYLENRIGISSAERNYGDDAMSEAAKPTQRRQSAPAAAPVSRNGTGTGSRPISVRLSAAEREMASMMKMTDEEYARNKVALQKEGRI